MPASTQGQMKFVTHGGSQSKRRGTGMQREGPSLASRLKRGRVGELRYAG